MRRDLHVRQEVSVRLQCDGKGKAHNTGTAGARHSVNGKDKGNSNFNPW